MAHSLASSPAAAIRVCHQAPANHSGHNNNITISRRSLSFNLGLAVVALSGGDRSAIAAARRPPPPPPTQKKDPNVSGVQAKVAASKRRKDAMKQEIAKLRLKGNTKEEQTSSPPP